MDSIETRRKNRVKDSSKIRLGDRHFKVEYDTVGGAMWTGTIYMGRFTPLDVVFDTGSDWLVIESTECENC